MKTMKLALLGGAALAVMTAGAQADELSDLKAQMEALNARVAAMEAAPAVPAGYSLMTISEGDAIVIPGLEETDAASYGKKATVIGILPTADAPASTEITWSGFARAALVYTHESYDDSEDDSESDMDVVARGEVKVVGKTDTAVGEVGALVKLRANWRDLDLPHFSAGGSGEVSSPEAWGWWAMTPELTLGGGYTGSLGNVGYGYDGACNCYYTDNADVAMNPGDAAQMRLSYASGPISFGIAVEDADNGSGLSDGLGAAAEIKYAGDTFNGEVSGFYRNLTGFAIDNVWGIGAGIGFALGDMASISLGGQMGHVKSGQDVWTASILGSVNLSDAVHAEVAFGHKNYDDDVNVGFGTGYDDTDAVLAGIYYDPVAQLTIGLEGEHIMDDSGTATMVDLVTVFRF